MKFTADLSVSFDEEYDGKNLEALKKIYQHIGFRIQQASSSNTHNLRVAVLQGSNPAIRMTQADVQSFTTIQITGQANRSFILVISLNDLYIHGYILNHGDDAYYYHFSGLAIQNIPGTQTVETNLEVTYPSTVKDGTHRIGHGPLCGAINRMESTNGLPIQPTTTQYSSYQVSNSIVTLALMISEGMRIQLMRQLNLRLMGNLQDDQIGPANGAYITNWSKLGEQLQGHYMVYPDGCYALNASEELSYELGTYTYRETFSRVADILKILLLIKFYQINTDRKPEREFKRDESDFKWLSGRANFKKNLKTFQVLSELGVVVTNSVDLSVITNIDIGLSDYTTNDKSILSEEWCSDIGIVFLYENGSVTKVTIVPGNSAGTEHTDSPDLLVTKYVYYGDRINNGILSPKITLRDTKTSNITELTEEMLSMNKIAITKFSLASDIIKYMSRNGILMYKNPKYTVPQFKLSAAYLYNKNTLTDGTSFT